MANGDENINPEGTEKTNQNLQETKKLVISLQRRTDRKIYETSKISTRYWL